MLIKYKLDNIEHIIDNVIEIKKFFNKNDEGMLEDIVIFVKKNGQQESEDVRISGNENLEKFRYIFVMNDEGKTIERIV